MVVLLQYFVSDHRWTSLKQDLSDLRFGVGMRVGVLMGWGEGRVEDGGWDWTGLGMWVPGLNPKRLAQFQSGVRDPKHGPWEV